MSAAIEILSGRYTPPARRPVSSKHRMPKAPSPAIVFVDIDSVPPGTMDSPGTLAGVLETLATERIIVILCSHGTRAEVEGVRQKLGIYHPFVCEGGAVLFVPEKYFGSDIESTRRVGGYQAIEFGAPYEQVVDMLRRVSDRLNLEVEGFHDMSVEQVARECGVSLLDARRMKLREYAESFRILSANPVAERRLIKALESAGLTCQSRGAFLHAGSVRSASPAVATLTTLSRVALGPVLTAGFGDGVLSGDVMRRIDNRLDAQASDASPARGPGWLERIIHEIANIRDARLSWPAARHTR
jgi:predicted mannosyl-3-phosphoglycerate phosphatase (HAD superfamily)